MDPMPIEDLALLEVLKRIDQGVELVDVDGTIRRRLTADALAVEGDGGALGLTSAGVELAKSLQHRMEADSQAAKLLRRRDGADAGQAGSGGAG